MYVKYISETQIEYPPKNKDNIINYNLDTELLIQDGYKEFVPVVIPETNRRYHINYVENDNNVAEVIVYDETQEDADTREAQQEAERVGNLTMTALDFIGVLEHYGLDYATQIKPFLESQPDLDKQLKYCQNVYCKVAKSVMPITVGDITITAEMVENAFKIKNGEIQSEEILSEDEIPF